MHFNFEGKRLQFYTGYRMDFTQWDVEKQEMKRNNFNTYGESSQFINSELKRYEHAIREIYEKSVALEQHPSVQDLREELNKRFNNEKVDVSNLFFDRFEQYIKEAEISEGRKKQLNSTMNHFKRFSNDKTLYFENVTKQTLVAFKEYLKQDKEAPKGKNTNRGHIKKVTCFFKICAE